MPTEDGYSLIQQIRHQKNSDIPAIALTAFAREEDKQQAIKAGFDLHLPKPIDSVELIKFISQLVRV